jgi:hypothetical protein
MMTKNYKLLPAALLGNLRTAYATNFPHYVNARVVINQTGSFFLVLPLPEPDNDYEILVEISNERLNILKNRGLSLIHPFKEPEKGFYYLARVNSGNQVDELYYIQPGEEQFNLPFLDSISIDFKLIGKPLPFNLYNFAVQRNRITINIRFEAPGLADNMKIWAIKNFLIPYTDLIKTALLNNNNLKYNARTIERKLNLGFSKIRHKCIEGLFEVDPCLFKDNTELDNLINLNLLLDTEDPDEIIQNLGHFENKKIIPDYIKILRAIISNKAKLYTQMATPAEEYKEIIFDYRKAVKIKRTMESGLPPESYEETVIGVLTVLNFEKVHAPLFTLHSTVEEKKYCGTIAANLVPDMSSQTFNFRNMEYECKLKIEYTPPTEILKEKYEYTLLNISELSEDNETLNPENQ